MVNKKTIAGVSGLLTILGASVLGNFLSKPSRAFVQKPSQPYSARVEQKTANIYSPGTCPLPEKIDPRVVPVPKSNPEDYIVKPHPYKEGTFLIAPYNEKSSLDTGGWRASSNDYTQLKVINPDGSVHYEIQIKDKDGRVITKYCEPSNERYIRNPSFARPQFHSTLPIIKNPDGSIYFYRDREEGESLEKVLRECPIEIFIPDNQTSPVPEKIDPRVVPVPKSNPDVYEPTQAVIPFQPRDLRVYGPSRNLSINPYGNELPPMPVPREK